jgi:cell division septal protein FtsQ
MRRPQPVDRAPGMVRRLLWFVALWVGGVAVVAAVAYLLRWVLM